MGWLSAGWLVCAVVLLSGGNAARADNGSTQEDGARLVAAITRAAVPDETPDLPPRDVDAPCNDGGLRAVLSLIDAGRLSDRPGTVILVVKAQACGWLGKPAGQELATHYQARARDPVALALIARTFGGISRDDYLSFARPYTASLMPNGAALNVSTAALTLDVAAGYCAPVLDHTCLGQALRNILPTGWRLEDAAGLAFGDVFDTPLPTLPDSAADALVAFIEHSALPIRSDLLDRVPDPPRSSLQAMRDRFYRHAYGITEKL